MNHNQQNLVTTNTSVEEHANNSSNQNASGQGHAQNPTVVFYHIQSGVLDQEVYRVPELVTMEGQRGLICLEDQLGQAVCLDMLLGLSRAAPQVVPDQLWLDMQPNDFTGLPATIISEPLRLTLAVVLNQINNILEWDLDFVLQPDGLWKYEAQDTHTILLNGPKKKNQEFIYDWKNVRTLNEKFTQEEFHDALNNLTPSYKHNDGSYEVKNCSFNVTDGTHTMKFWSSTDGLCGLNALLFMTKVISDYESVASVYQAKYPDGISERDFQTLCNQLHVPCHPTDYFYESFGSTNISKITSSESVNRLESIALWDVYGRDGHVYVVYDPRSRTRKLINDSADIEHAILNPKIEAPQPLLQKKKPKSKKQLLLSEQQKQNKIYRVHFSNEYLKTLKNHSFEDNCRCSQEAARLSILKQMGNLVDYEPTCYAGAVYWAWAFKKTNKHLWESVPLEQPAIIEEAYKLDASKTLLNGIIKDVNKNALRSCGEELIAALHCDNTPINLSRTNLQTKNDYYDVISDQIVPRIRGTNLPKSAYKYFSVQGIPVLQQENEQRDRFGGSSSFDDILHLHTIARTLRTVNEYSVYGNRNLRIISDRPEVFVEAIVKTNTSMVPDIMPKLESEFSNLEGVWRRYMRDFRNGKPVDLAFEIDQSAQISIQHRIPGIIIQHDQSAPYGNQYSLNNMGSWHSANSAEQPQYMIGQDVYTVQDNFEFRCCPITIRIVDYVPALHNLQDYLSRPFEHYKTITNTLHNIALVTQSPLLSAHVTALKAVKIPWIVSPRQINLYTELTPRTNRLMHELINVPGLIQVFQYNNNIVDLTIIDDQDYAFYNNYRQFTENMHFIIYRTFHKLPGRYELPLGEGRWYNIQGNDQITVAMRDTAKIRTVPKIDSANNYIHINTGWAGWAGAQIRPGNDILIYSDPPGLMTDSVQSSWLSRYLDKLPKGKDLMTVMELKNKFTEFTIPDVENDIKIIISQQQNTLRRICHDQELRELDDSFYLKYYDTDKYPYRIHPVDTVFKSLRASCYTLIGSGLSALLTKFALRKTAIVVLLSCIGFSYASYIYSRKELQWKSSIYKVQPTDWMVFRQFANKYNIYRTIEANHDALTTYRLLNGKPDVCYYADVEQPVKRSSRTKTAEYKGTSHFANFYKTKPIEQIKCTNTEVDPTGSVLKRMQDMYQWVLKNPRACVKNNTLEEIDTMRTVSVFSGHHVIQQSFEVKEFEWCHKQIQNQYAALYRHVDYVGSPTEITQFQEFAKEMHRDIQNRLLLELHHFQASSVFEYPAKAFPDDINKQNKYIQNLQRSLQERIYEKGPYKVMVKSGEVQTVQTPEQYDKYGNLIHDSRPRNIMVPQGIGYSLLAAVQHQIMPLLRKTIPEFIQAYSSDQLAQVLQEHGLNDPVSVSIDGSGFDSTQHLILKQIVENPLYDSLQPFIAKIFQHPENITSDPEVTREVLLAAKQHCQTLFVKTPGLTHSNWTKEEKRLYQYIKDKGEYTPLTISGTTFSGDPLTTLGNTLRSIFYVKYYLRDVPQSAYRLYVAGDDVAILCERSYQELIVNNIEEQTARSRENDSPLGQCVKQIVSGEFEQLDFCSKWIFNLGGRVYVSRDYEKTIKERQYYTKSNSMMLNHPGKHRAAILKGLEAEQASILLEDIFRINSTMHVEDTEYQRYAKKRAHHDKMNYEIEELINLRLQICHLDLFNLCQHNALLNGNKTSD